MALADMLEDGRRLGSVVLLHTLMQGAFGASDVGGLASPAFHAIYTIFLEAKVVAEGAVLDVASLSGGFLLEGRSEVTVFAVYTYRKTSGLENPSYCLMGVFVDVWELEVAVIVTLMRFIGFSALVDESFRIVVASGIELSHEVLSVTTPVFFL